MRDTLTIIDHGNGCGQFILMGPTRFQRRMEALRIWLACLALALACALPGMARAQASAPCMSSPPGYACTVSRSGDAVTVTLTAKPADPIVNWSWTPPPPPGIAPADLVAAIAKAKGGDTIALAPGPFPALVIRNQTFSPPLTITSADPAHRAVLADFQVSSVSGARLVGVDVHDPAPATAASPIVYIQTSSDIVLDGVNVSGSVDFTAGVLFGKGVSVLRGSNVLIKGGSVAHTFKGVDFADSSDATLQGVDIYDVRTSPVGGGGALARITIDANHIHDIHPVARFVDHSDGIHFQTKSGAPITDLTISNNLMEQADATGTLGINLQGTPDAGFVNVHVVGNTLRWNNNQAATTNWVLSGEFTANLLLAAPGLDNPFHCCGFIFRNSGPAVTVTGNTAKDNIYMAPYRANTFLTAAQIAADGAKQ